MPRQPRINSAQCRGRVCDFSELADERSSNFDNEISANSEKSQTRPLLFWMLWRTRFLDQLVAFYSGCYIVPLILLTLIGLIYVLPMEMEGGKSEVFGLMFGALALFPHATAYGLFGFLFSAIQELRPQRTINPRLATLPSVVRIGFGRLGYLLYQVSIVLIGINVGLAVGFAGHWVALAGGIVISSLLIAAWQIRRVYREFKSNYAAWFDEKITEVFESGHREEAT